jgi:Flp pilus assembly protein TadG
MNRWRARRDQGSVAIEVAILIPVFAMLIGLAVVEGRSVLAQAAIENAAFTAARVASLDRDQITAEIDGENTAHQSLDAQNLTCSSLTVHVDTTEFNHPLGTPANVSVKIICVLQFNDFSALPGTPPTRTLTATFISPIDEYRGRT